MRKSGRSSASEPFISRGLALLALVSCAPRGSLRGPGPSAVETASSIAATPVLAGPSASLPANEGPPAPSHDGRTTLRDGWRLISSTKLKDTGGAISTPGYADRDWYAAKVPSTVLAALVDAGVYREPYKGDNLRRIPQGDFARSWWYRCEFDLVGGGERTLIAFDGINYRANIWLNGKLVAPSTDMRGTLRSYMCD